MSHLTISDDNIAYREVGCNDCLTHQQVPVNADNLEFLVNAFCPTCGDQLTISQD